MPSTWAPIEIFWTLNAALGIVPAALYFCWQCWRDLRAARLRPGRRDRVAAAWWWLSVGALFLAIGLSDTAIGILAGNAPERRVEVGDVETAASTVAAFAFIGQQIATQVALYSGLWLARRLYLGARP